MKRLRIGPLVMRLRDEPEPPPSPSKSGPPVVFLHGAGMSSVVWMDILRQVSPLRRVIAPDLPGHGQSDPWHTPSLALYRDAVGTMCAHLQVPKVVLVGHSLGGAIALSCALEHPDRVAGLVLVASSTALSLPKEVLIALERELPPGDDTPVEHLPDSLRSLCFSPSTHKETVRRWQAVLMQATRGVVLSDFALCEHLNLRDDPRRLALNLPMLVVGGADDLLVQKTQLLQTQADLPHAQLAMIPNAGHLPMLEQPGPFVEALRSFLRSNTPHSATPPSTQPTLLKSAPQT